MGFSGDYQEDIGIEKTNIAQFFEDVKGTLKAMAFNDFPMEKTMSDGRVVQMELSTVRKPYLVIGAPGIGKTCGILSAVKEINDELEQRGMSDRKFKLRKIMLGQTIVGEMQGLPVNFNGEVRRLQSPDLPKTDGSEEYGVLFLDEITTADEAQVLPALAFTDDTRNIGTYSLPEHWLVICAGNGPESSNFNRLDDTVLNRCRNFDIEFDYKRDWRPWAQANNINPLIIAFLNFEPKFGHMEVATEEDRAGKAFASPRSWTNLSQALDNREFEGRPVSQDNLYQFAASFVGTEAAGQFSAFCAFKDEISFDATRILEGTEKMPTGDIKVQQFHILMQSIANAIKTMLREEFVDEDESTGEKNYTSEGYEKMGNAIRWLLELKKYMLDLCVEGIIQIRTEVPDAVNILADRDFADFCPEFDDFIVENADVLNQVLV